MFKLNKLSLNVDRIKWLLFNPLSKRQVLLQALTNFLIEKIHFIKEHVKTFLGVFINENWSWKQHINIVRSKIFKSIGVIYKSRDELSKQCPEQL